MKPITYTNMSWSNAQRLKTQRRREYEWEQAQKRIEIWKAACTCFDKSHEALMESTKKLSQQVASKLG